MTPQAKEHEPPAAASVGGGGVPAVFFGEGEAFTEECFVQAGEDG